MLYSTIGKNWDSFSVLDSQFRIVGVDNLRDDASLFPTIHEIFVQVTIFMINKKDADVVLIRP